MDKKNIILAVVMFVIGAVVSVYIDIDNYIGKGRTTVYDYSISKSDLNDYYSAGGMNKNSKIKDRSIQSYIERNAMASVIDKERGFNKAQVSIELNRLRNELIIKKYIESKQTELTSEEALKAYYEENIDKFSTFKVKAAQILISLKQGADQEQHDAKKAIAEEVLGKIKAGSAFEELVKEYSDDAASKNKAGEIGILETGGPNRALLDAIKKLGKGETTNIITSNLGFHILKVLEAPEVEKKPFDEIKDKIEYELKYDAKVNELNRLKERALKENM